MGDDATNAAGPQAVCACGAHVLQLSKMPRRATMCFCDPCRKRTGGPFGLAAYVRRAGLELPRLSVRRRIADSGRWLDNYFCDQCGTVLYYDFEMVPGVVGVPVGLFEGGHQLRPHRAVFCEQKPDWFVLPDGIEALTRGSDSEPFTEA